MTETQPWPPNIKPGLPTTEVLGMELPIIADLGDGWFLVAHPNGAAIATEKFLSALWSESTETAVYEDGVEIEDEDCCPIPESVRAKAVEEFEELAWPLVRGQFYTEAKETTSVHTAIPDKAVERLRKLEGSDAPEDRCDRCGGRNLHNWYADSDVWNRVAGDYSILCPICFSELAQEAGVGNGAWRLSLKGDDPEISKVHTQLHNSLNEGAKLWARVAQLEHEADCCWYDLAAGEWALAHCEECRRLDEIVKNTAKLGNPPGSRRVST